MTRASHYCETGECIILVVWSASTCAHAYSRHPPHSIKYTSCIMPVRCVNCSDWTNPTAADERTFWFNIGSPRIELKSNLANKDFARLDELDRRYLMHDNKSTGRQRLTKLFKTTTGPFVCRMWRPNGKQEPRHYSYFYVSVSPQPVQCVLKGK